MICLDASVVGMMISPDEKSGDVLAAYEKESLAHGSFIAPWLLPFEVASLLRKKQLRKLLSGPEILGALQFYRELPIQPIIFDGFVEKILSLTQAFGKNVTVYDASYLAVAEHSQATLWTADKEFYRLVVDYFANIRLFS